MHGPGQGQSCPWTADAALGVVAIDQPVPFKRQRRGDFFQHSSSICSLPICWRSSGFLACPPTYSLVFWTQGNSSRALSSSCRFKGLTWIGSHQEVRCRPMALGRSAAISWIILRPLITSMVTLALNPGLWVRRLFDPFGEGCANGGSLLSGVAPWPRGQRRGLSRQT